MAFFYNGGPLNGGPLVRRARLPPTIQNDLAGPSHTAKGRTGFVSKLFVALVDDEDATPVLGPGFLVGSENRRPLLTVADRGEPVRSDA